MVNITKIADIVFKLLPVLNIFFVVFISISFLNLLMVFYGKHWRYLFYSIFTFIIAIGCYVGMLYANHYLKIARSIYTKLQTILTSIQTVVQGATTNYQQVLQQVLTYLKQIQDLFDKF